MLLESVGQRLKFGLPHFFTCAMLALWFIYMNYMPLFHTDLWGHVNYGHWMLEHRQLPQEDPILTNAEGVDIIASAWFSQILMALIQRAGGDEWLSHSFAFISLAIAALIWGIFYQYMRRPAVCTCAAFVILLLGSTRIAVYRTETFGELCMVIMLFILTLAQRVCGGSSDIANGTKADANRNTFWFVTISIPLLFLFWANAHGSFVVGLAVMGCQALGRMMEVGWSTRSIRGILEDRWFRRWVLWTELAVGACLINPYGIDLLINALTFPKNPNLKDITEWYGMRFGDFEAIYFGISIIIMLVLMRFSRERVYPYQLLSIGLVGYSTVSSVRMIWWYAVVFAFAMAPHVQNVIERLWPADRFWRPEGEMTLRNMWRKRLYLWTSLCLLMIWFGFTVSPISNPAFGSKPRAPEMLYSQGTPLGVTRFLHEHPPEGAVWNPQWWGDWLAWYGPRDLDIFMTTNAVHVVPNRVWKDYMRIATAYSGWASTLSRYNINTIIVNKPEQRALYNGVRLLPAEWKMIYEDDQAVIVTREEKLKKVKLQRNLKSEQAEPDNENEPAPTETE
ncbi:MAG: hypothetical protein ACKVT0_23355 [Planctomycetaceae bacterium]